MLQAVRGTLWLDVDLLIWECLVLVCPELVEIKKLQPDETRLQFLWVWKAFWSVERLSLLECWCFMELCVAGREGCVLSWWQTGSCTKSWFQSGPACWLWLSFPPFVDALFFFSLLWTDSLNLESFRKCCSFGIEWVSWLREKKEPSGMKRCSDFSKAEGRMKQASLSWLYADRPQGC